MDRPRRQGPRRAGRAKATLDAVRTLLSQGWTTRGAGKALNLSHQRISQLAPGGTA
ncbi:hypothetical protein GCM10022221_51740 [Actinocorallia aurea]